MRHFLLATADRNRVLVNDEWVNCLDERTADALAYLIQRLSTVAGLACKAASGDQDARLKLHDEYDYANSHGCLIRVPNYGWLVSELAEEV